MKCQACKHDMFINNSSRKSPIETDVITETIEFVCVNANCTLFCGNNLANPTKSIKVEREAN